jgi:hypothetical protein
MTQETSNHSDDRPLDVTVGVIKRLILYGMERRSDSTKDGRQYGQAFSDGYICALRHVLEAESE